MKLLNSSSGKWEEERLLLWAAVTHLQEGLKQEKAHARKQIDAAHQKIRGLEATRRLSRRTCEVRTPTVERSQ